ncbi:iron complex outermembrane receptor protein [Pararhizobium capsulatum DSM 1112]|uniref:Iron complex outermembrane receptor protein n=1 Tax=Pararhizobium capsulatum DSM 1112 TaxID=1121113 RepID=A0ABU0BIB4_9HYPH|nr:TonB-dependent siderophore receptor [Pararhizobium capsulatum]MDQ0317996.1 iron complex outermembrane receptor protein [Pararhizobium capsulatum DSM 1112]
MPLILLNSPTSRALRSSTMLFGIMAALVLPSLGFAQDADDQTTRLETLRVNGDGNGEAQTISEDNDTVVPTRAISALKTDTPLIETPRAVSVVTRKEIEERGATDMIQAARYSSGVTTGAFGYDPRFDQIYIRGIETTTTGDFRDGLRQPIMTYGSFATEVYTLDRIEILKGPVSVIYGAASAAGIVNRISKLPLEETHREIELQYGTIGRKQAAFDFGGPINDEMFYRVVGLARDGEGSYDIADDRYLLQPSFTWKPDDSTTFTIYGLAQKGETAASAWSFERDGNIYLYTDPDYNSQKVEQYQLGYQLEHEFDNGLTFRQNARAGDVDLKAHYLNRVFTNPDGSWPTTAVTDSMRTYQIDNQLEAKFDTGAISHTLLTGLDYTWVTSDFAMGSASILPGSAANAAIPTLDYFTGSDLNQTGLYAQDQMELGNWRFVGGLRYDWARQESTVKGSGSTDTKDDGVLSGQAGLLYLFDNGIAPYVSYGTSFVPSTALSADGTVLDPTKGRQIEAGIKYQPEGENYSLSGAVYRLVETGKPQYDPSFLFSENSGENTYTGFELEGRTEFDNGISLIAAYTYADAEITDNIDPALIGNTPSTVPRHVASLWVNYLMPDDTALTGVSIGGGIRATSGSFTSDANTDKNPGAFYFDASLSYDFGVKSPELQGLSLAISATNLADRREQVCTDGYCYIGQSRTVIGSLKYKW